MKLLRTGALICCFLLVDVVLLLLYSIAIAVFQVVYLVVSSIRAYSTLWNTRYGCVDFNICLLYNVMHWACGACAYLW